MPADGVVLVSQHCAADESLLTGESVPVSKSTNAQDNTVHAGSFVVRGQGLARVTATGQRSQIGRIGQSLNELTSGTTPLQAQTAQLVQRLAVIVLLMCIELMLNAVNLNFIDFIVAPLFVSMRGLMPSIKHCCDQLAANRQRWDSLMEAKLLAWSPGTGGKPGTRAVQYHRNRAAIPFRNFRTGCPSCCGMIFEAAPAFCGHPERDY